MMFERMVVILAISTLLLVASFSTSNDGDVLHLTTENYDMLTMGKTLFVMYYAPWCTHSKKMAHDFERLFYEWQNHDVGLVAKIDCSTQQKLCGSKVRSFPTLKYGVAADEDKLTVYEGGRSFDDMNAFCRDNLKPQCTPKYPEQCSDPDTRALLDEFLSMSNDELLERIKVEKKLLKKVTNDFYKESDKVLDQHDELLAEKDRKVQEVRDSGLDLAKTVKAYKEALLAAGSTQAGDEL